MLRVAGINGGNNGGDFNEKEIHREENDGGEGNEGGENEGGENEGGENEGGENEGGENEGGENKGGITDLPNDAPRAAGDDDVELNGQPNPFVQDTILGIDSDGILIPEGASAFYANVAASIRPQIRATL